ncbi:hypothetical protein D3C78_1476120 [compost metagenome]
MDDARGDLQVLGCAHCIPESGDDIEQRLQRQGFRLVVDLQGADAGRQVDHAGEFLGFQRLHQRMGAEAQDQVQLGLADFQQQVGVAGEAGDQAGVIRTDVQHDGRWAALTPTLSQGERGHYGAGGNSAFPGDCGQPPLPPGEGGG